MASADTRATIGRAAETAALNHLRQAGLQEVARNVACRGGELDLVMRDGAVLVFVEVRYRRNRRFGGAAASIDAGKRRRLTAAAQAFLQRHPELARMPCRFDVIEASGAIDAPDLHWIRAAFGVDG